MRRKTVIAEVLLATQFPRARLLGTILSTSHSSGQFGWMNVWQVAAGDLRLWNGLCGWLPRCKGKMRYIGIWSGADFCPAC